MICTSCGKHKDASAIRTRKSKLITGMPLFLCESCLTFEPRFVIILVARQPGGMEKVADYIRKKRYVGEPIHATDLV